MKKYLPILVLALAGCQATIPENSNTNNEIEDKILSTTIKVENTKYNTLIENPSYIEDNDSKPGEYPQQYQYIIANKIQAKPTTLFKPIPYVTSKKINGWGTCYINYSNSNSEYFLAIIKNNKILETFSSKEIAKNCEDLRLQQAPIEEAKESALQEETIKNFSSIVDNPDKFHLFGEPPKTPAKIIKNQLNFFLEDPQSAEINNISVRKTFLISQDVVIYCYLVFVDLKTKDLTTGKYREAKKAIFYMKDDKILNHKIFSKFTSGLKPKKEFQPPELIEDTQDTTRVKKTFTVPDITKNIKPVVNNKKAPTSKRNIRKKK